MESPPEYGHRAPGTHSPRAMNSVAIYHHDGREFDYLVRYSVKGHSTQISPVNPWSKYPFFGGHTTGHRHHYMPAASGLVSIHPSVPFDDENTVRSLQPPFVAVAYSHTHTNPLLLLHRSAPFHSKAANYPPLGCPPVRRRPLSRSSDYDSVDHGFQASRTSAFAV